MKHGCGCVRSPVCLGGGPFLLKVLLQLVVLLRQRRHSRFGFCGRGCQPASLVSKCSPGAEMRNQCPCLTKRLSVGQSDTCVVRSLVLIQHPFEGGLDVASGADHVLLGIGDLLLIQRHLRLRQFEPLLEIRPVLFLHGLLKLLHDLLVGSETGLRLRQLLATRTRLFRLRSGVSFSFAHCGCKSQVYGVVRNIERPSRHAVFFMRVSKRGHGASSFERTLVDEIALANHCAVRWIRAVCLRRDRPRQ